MMKYCAKCGAEIAENSKFCEKCGNKVDVDFPDNRNKKNRVGKIAAVVVVAAAIAVAGYMQYTRSQKNSDLAKEVSADTNESTYEISGEDRYSAEDIFTDTEASEETSASAEENLGIQTGEEIAQANRQGDEVENPEDAVLTSNNEESIDFAEEARLNREQVRSKNKETLLEIINNAGSGEEQKQAAIDAMVAMTDIAEREAAAEILLEAKGYTDVVVSIMDNNADVVLNMGEVTDAKRAQVEDIVKRKTNVAAENIIITPLQNQAKESQTGKESDQENGQNEDVKNLGEAVLIAGNNEDSTDFASKVKANREQIRSQNKETLLEIINNSGVGEEQKQAAVDAMVAITNIAEREAAAEMLLEAKGFTDVVVSITDNNADVVLNMGEVTDAKRAQVEDIVKRKTNVAGENIKITPLQNLAKEEDSTEENEVAIEAAAEGEDAIGAEDDAAGGEDAIGAEDDAAE